MGLIKSLACIFFMIFLLSLPISISSVESSSNSTSPHSNHPLHGLVHHVGTKEYDTNHSPRDTTKHVHALNEDGDGKFIRSYIRKGGHGGTGGGGGGGANSASHHTPSPHKNRASFLSPPSSFIAFMVFCIMIFGFFFFPL